MPTQIMAHRAGSRKHPNSVAAVRDVLQHQPHIIELDIRLSRDNELVCYHGNLLETLGIYSSSRFFTAAQLERRGIPRFAELARTINGHADIFLDIKDYRVQPEQIFSIFDKGSPRTWYVGARNADYFTKFRRKPDNLKFCIIYSMGLQRTLHRYKVRNVDVVDVLPWMITQQRVDHIKALHMDFSPSAIFDINRYLDTVTNLGAKWISVYDVPFYRKLLASFERSVL